VDFSLGLFIFSIEAQMSKRKRHGSKAEADQADHSGRFRCKHPSWWDKYSAEELELMHERGRQLRECGHGYVDWDSVIGRK
jgi:hypothetical protein